MINNATRHDFSRQEHACDLTGCSFYFGGCGRADNSARATLLESNVLLFKLKEAGGDSMSGFSMRLHRTASR